MGAYSEVVAATEGRVLGWHHPIYCPLVQVREASDGLPEVRKPSLYCAVATVETSLYPSLTTGHRHRQPCQLSGQRSHAAANCKGHSCQKPGVCTLKHPPVSREKAHF